jgi:hypothetical protein
MTDDGSKDRTVTIPQVVVAVLVLAVGGAVVWLFLDMRREIRQLRDDVAMQSVPIVEDARDTGPSGDGSGPLTPTTCPGRIPQDQILEVVGRHGRDVFECYGQALDRDSGLEGKLGIDIFVDTEGVVLQVFVSGMIRDAGLEDCIEAKIVKWDFPGSSAEPCGWLMIPFMLTPENLAETMKGGGATP